MDDLIATISSSGVGQQAADLKELHSALASTLQRGPAYRPIPPNAAGPHSGDAIPPAPASSWNDPTAAVVSPPHLWAAGMGNSPRQTVPIQVSNTTASSGFSSTVTGPATVPFTGRRETGFSPGPEVERGSERPHHSVLPANASPAETVGFANDAFRPLWDKQPKSPWAGFNAATAAKTA
jgi:hypothetical protein